MTTGLEKVSINVKEQADEKSINEFVQEVDIISQMSFSSDDRNSRSGEVNNFPTAHQLQIKQNIENHLDEPQQQMNYLRVQGTQKEKQSILNIQQILTSKSFNDKESGGDFLPSSNKKFTHQFIFEKESEVELKMNFKTDENQSILSPDFNKRSPYPIAQIPSQMQSSTMKTQESQIQQQKSIKQLTDNFFKYSQDYMKQEDDFDINLRTETYPDQENGDIINTELYDENDMIQGKYKQESAFEVAVIQSEKLQKQVQQDHSQIFKTQSSQGATPKTPNSNRVFETPKSRNQHSQRKKNPFKIAPLIQNEGIFQKNTLKFLSKKSTKQISSSKTIDALEKQAEMDFQNLISESTSNVYADLIQEELPWYIINPLNPNKNFWNTALVCIVLFTAIKVPASLAFPNEVNYSFDQVVNLLIDSIFIVDLCLNFFTYFENNEGERIVSLYLIFTNYLKAGCFWYFISTLSPNQNWFLNFYTNTDQSLSTKYISSVYYVLSVLTTVGYGNIVSSNASEYTFTIFFMFFAVIIYSWIFGVLTYSFSKITENSIILKNKFIFFNQIVANYKLNRNLQEKLLRTVQIGISSSSNRILDIYQNNDIINDLPEETVSLICQDIFHHIVAKIPFLINKPPLFVSKLIQKVKSIHMNPGDLLYKKGTIPKDVYLLINGRVVTKIQSSFLNFKTLVYVEGSFFGEVDMIFRRERKQSAYAETKCEIWRISKKDFFSIICFSEEIKRDVLQQAIKREELMMKEEMKLLRAKLQDNPNLHTVMYEELFSNQKASENEATPNAPNQNTNNNHNIGEIINEEIALQSKKKAYNSNINKEVSLTDIIKISTKRLIVNEEQNEIEKNKDPLIQSQLQLKDVSIEKMIKKINERDHSSLTKTAIFDCIQTKKYLTNVQWACGIMPNTLSSENKFKDEELEHVISNSLHQIRSSK